MYKPVREIAEKELIGKTVSFVYGPGEHPGLDYNDNIGIIKAIEKRQYVTEAKVLMQNSDYEYIVGLHVGWTGSEGIGSYLH